ncbi:T-cell-specific surface glycoprotein CD28 [Dicentrarchus labrax]|uniref:T-cell-specific surface glycoprotein CD28 n=1 Tax=Dicentrarchus labrax TaxID=13489 RepID=A0A076YGX5_DICLA|nr:T-cell-specific surface glycoprotein CD28 [Dicentrarchus labrax]AIK66542.1 T-cell-specific surface glycoprotein CD28 [Dicentrarchus labrax]
MSACWMLVILVGCRLLHTTQSQSTCNDQLQTVCEAAGNNVSVPCPNMTGEVFTTTVLKEDKIIFEHTCHKEGYSLECTPSNTSSNPIMVGMELHKHEDNETVSYILKGVNASSHGIYRCVGKDLFPPPLKEKPSDLKILLLIKGHQCNPGMCDNAHEDQTTVLPWILTFAAVSIYSVTVTIFAIVSWIKLRRTDSQSDYMNTKPKASRDRKKKRGVQNPIPKHF